MMMVKKQITHLMLYSVVIVVAAVVLDVVVANILTDHKTLFHSLQITLRS